MWQKFMNLVSQNQTKEGDIVMDLESYFIVQYNIGPGLNRCQTDQTKCSITDK